MTSEELLKHYFTLGIEPGATLKEIKEAHRLCVQAWHPDKHVNNAKLAEKGLVQTRKINAAFDALHGYFEQEALRAQQQAAEDERVREAHRQAARERTQAEQEARKAPQQAAVPQGCAAGPLFAGLMCLLCLPGSGQVLNGQFGKGFCMFILTFSLSGMTGGVAWLFLAPIAALDAYICGNKKRLGQLAEQDEMEWF